MIIKVFCIIFVIKFSFEIIKEDNINTDKDNRIDTPLTKGDFDYRNINIEFRFPGYKIRKGFINNENKIRMKKELMSIPFFLENLIYINAQMRKINLDKNVLKRFEIKLSEEDMSKFKEEKVQADLLILIRFIKMKKRIAMHELYKQSDDEDSVDENRCKIALLEVNSRYNFSEAKSEDEFKYGVIREIFKILGLRKGYLKSNRLKNNFSQIPYYLIKDLNSFKSYKKYLEFTNRTYNKILIGNNSRSYYTYWNNSLGLHDIMTEELYSDVAITELTTNLFNDLDIYTINQCDIFKYGAGFGRGFNCLKPEQNCLDRKEINNYFLEYGIYNKNRVKCYLNSKENIKNKQCGVLSGNLAINKYRYRFSPNLKPIKPIYKIGIQPIPELDFYENQTLKLLRNGKFCPSNTPRSVFFSVPPSIFNEFSNSTNITLLIEELENINKDIEYDEIVLKKEDKQYFVTYQAYEDYYSRESVKSVLNHSGVIRSYSFLNMHNLMLKSPGPSVFRKMGFIPKFLKFCSYMGYDLLASKDNTYLFYKKMKDKFGDDFNYLSETYLYPEDKKIINDIFKNYVPESENLWLIKPKYGSLGEGIYFFKNLTSNPNDYLLTKYINHPHLINKKKYDFRIYVLVTGLTPLKIYLYQEGIVRFSTKDYLLDVDKLNDLYIHITNVDLNKKNKEEYKFAKKVDTDEGSKWSLKVYEKYCKNNNIDYKSIRRQIADVSIKSIISIYKEYLRKLRSSEAKNNNFFQLYGFDFLLDENFKIHLIEVNDRPSLLMGDINDRKLKPQLVSDALNIIGIIPFSHNYKDNFIPFDHKGKNYSFQKTKEEEIQENVDFALCEFGRPRGRFDLIFPVKETINNYKKYFEEKIEENELLWNNLKE